MYKRVLLKLSGEALSNGKDNKEIIDASIGEAKRLCDLLNVQFDSWRGESYYNDKKRSHWRGC